MHTLESVQFLHVVPIRRFFCSGIVLFLFLFFFRARIGVKGRSLNPEAGGGLKAPACQEGPLAPCALLLTCVLCCRPTECGSACGTARAGPRKDGAGGQSSEFPDPVGGY